jgi:hypothetical protein
MRTCAHCGAKVKGNAKFCKACGRGLAGASASLQDKKARVMAAKKSSRVKPAVIAGAVVFAAAAFWIGRGFMTAPEMRGGQAYLAPQRDASSGLAAAEVVENRGGSVRIPLAAVNDGKAHFFAYHAGSKTIRFFAMKAPDGTIRTAFDACVACNSAKRGYRNESTYVVCNNCGLAFRPADIGVITGGCNPIPVNKSTDGQMVVLNARDLESGAKYF